MTASQIEATIDSLELRQVCGEWITGVTIVTSVDSAGTPVGMAVNSFSSLSLDPPLVLFCPAKTSSTWPKIQDNGRFAINILSSSQGQLPRTFAKPGAEKFVGVDYAMEAGLPVLSETSAHLVCSIVDILEGGDHCIVVGRVDSFERHEKEPLIFHRGKVVELVPAGDGQ